MNNKHIFKSLLAASIAAAMFGPAGAQAQTGENSQAGQVGSSTTAATASSEAKLTAADRKAITDMGMANMAEVELGKLAQSKSQNAEVKEFATKMVEDHGKAWSEVKALAQAKGVTLPAELDAKHKAMATRLEKLTGDSFDKTYVKQGGVGAHKETLTKLQKASKAAKDPDVKAQVDKTIPVVQAHLKQAEQLAKGGKPASPSNPGAVGHTGAGH